MKKIFLFLFFFNFFFLQSNLLYSEKGKTNKQVLAKVGDASITVDYFKKQKSMVDKTFNPPSTQQLLEDIVRFQMGVQEAKKNNLQDSFFCKKPHGTGHVSIIY